MESVDNVREFTVLGRGFDPEVVGAYVAAVIDRIHRAEAAAMIQLALADACATRYRAAEEADRIVLDTAIVVAELRVAARAEVERLERACAEVGRLTSSLAGALAARTDDIHFTIDPEVLQAVPSS